MNYIKLLHAAFEKFHLDTRLNPTHISLYMALFLEWNSNRFVEVFFINRGDLMQASKIGSKSTYHRCISDLNSWGYLSYFPSHNPYKGSMVKMTVLDSNDSINSEQECPTSGQVEVHNNPNNGQAPVHYSPMRGQALVHNRPINGQALVSTINITKQVNNIKQPKGWQEVKLFFIEKDFNADEGKKFFEYYKNRDWKTSDGNDIRDWKSIAINWMDRTELFSLGKQPNKKQVSHFKDNLRTTKDKDYGQPL